MAKELLSLDPPEVATGRTELALHLDAIQVAESGPDFGDAAIESYLADAARGSLPVDFRVPNRTVEIPLLVGAVAGAMTFDQARSALQQKAALLQREGGWLKRVLRDGRTVYLDVIEATLRLGGGTLQAQRDFDPSAVLTLQTLPDWYGDEEDLGAIASASPHLIFTLPTVHGDHPARTRIVVTDGSGQAQRGLLWGLRSRHYDPATTAALAYQAEALTPLDAAASASVGGQTVVRHTSLLTTWTPVLSTQVAGVGHMTHTGSYRVWARAHTTGVRAPVRLRLLWDVGDLVAPVTNPAVTLPASGSFCLVDLGIVHVDASPVGAHRWQGAIQGAAAAVGGDVSIDRVWLLPVDEGYGELRAPFRASDGPGLAGFTSHDEFNQVATPTPDLDAKTLAAGGAWATSGDTTDFAVDDTWHYVTRATTSGTNGRTAIAGTATPSAVVAQVDVQHSTGAAQVRSRLLARYTDANNQFYVELRPTATSVEILPTKVVAGAATQLADVTVAAAPGTFYTVRVQIDASGRYAVWFGEQGQTTLALIAEGTDTALATGGTLASGKVGFWDVNLSATAATRTYDTFAAWVPDADAVLNASLSAELRTDGMYRQSADGNGYGQVSHVIGDLPRLPAAGMEGRVTEVILKPSRGEPGVDADPAADALSAHVYARPSWLFVPEA